MEFVSYNLVTLVAFTAYVAAAICWQRTRPMPAQAGRCAMQPAKNASVAPTSRLFTNR